MRKKLRLVTSFALILLQIITAFSVCAVTPSATDETQADKRAIAAWGYLNALKAVDFEASDINEEISRQEFAKIACILSGANPTDSAQNNFSDVDFENEYLPYINSLVKMNVISANGNFEPERTITYSEAATMLVRILGYGARAEAKGGYPAGYIQTAKELKLSDGLLDFDDITKRDALVLCENALNTEVLRQVKSGATQKFETEKGYTLSYYSFGIVHLEGVVDAVDLTSLKVENPLKPYHMSIDKNIVNVGELDVREFLGYEVDAYCYDDPSSDKYVLKWINKTDGNDEKIIDINDIVSIKSGEIEYYTGSKTSKCRFSVTASVIYNDVSTAMPFNMDMIKDCEGTVRLLKNGTSLVNVIFVDAYTDYVVSNVNSFDEKIYDRYDNTKQLVINTTADDPYTIIYKDNGEEGYFGDISSGSVLSVYKSQNDADQKYIKIYLSDDKVSGVIDSINTSGSQTVVSIDGREYALSENCRTNCLGSICAGMKAELLLNAKGRCAGMNFDVSDMVFGYLKGIEKEKGINGKLNFRIFTDNGEFETLCASDRITVDGISYKSDDLALLSIFESASSILYPNRRTDLEEHCYAQPIRYSVNSGGFVISIDTVLKTHNPDIAATSQDVSGDNALYGWYTMSADERNKDHGLRFRQGVNSFGGRFVIDDTTKYLAYPSPEDTSVDYTDEQKYTAVKKSYFVGTIYYYVHPFCYTENNLRADYLLVEASEGTVIPSDEQLAVVKSVSMGTNGDENVKKIKVITKGGEQQILCKENFSFRKAANSSSTNPDAEKASQLPIVMTPTDLKTGDVIRYILTPSGYADNIELYCRLDGEFIVNNTSYASMDLRYIASNGFQIRYGYALKKYDVAFSIMRTNGFSNPDEFAAIGSVTDSEAELVPNYSSCTYIIYDSGARKTEDRVTTGSYRDIVAYKDGGAECSKILVQSSSCTPSVIIIVK